MDRVDSIAQPEMDGGVPVAIFRILTAGTAYPFSERLHESLPLAKPGIYTIWRQAEFLYVGIAGRGLDLNADHKKKRGLLDRLDSHRAGRRSGDQFAVYVATASSSQLYPRSR